MNEQDYYTSIIVDVAPEEAFKCINNVSRWWTENLEGNSEKLDDEFTVRFGDIHFSRQKLIEFISNEKVVWLVTDSKLSFVKEQQEWTNTKIGFEFTSTRSFTEIRFTHFGLVPDYECFEACSSAWSKYIHGSLLKLINTGKGEPELRDSKIREA